MLEDYRKGMEHSATPTIHLSSCTSDTTHIPSDSEYFSFSARAVKMLRTRSDSDEPGGNLSQNWKPFQQAKHEGQRLFPIRSLASDDATMNENLHCLNKPRRPFAARLHFAQIVHGNRTGS